MSKSNRPSKQDMVYIGIAVAFGCFFLYLILTGKVNFYMPNPYIPFK